MHKAATASPADGLVPRLGVKSLFCLVDSWENASCINSDTIESKISRFIFWFYDISCSITKVTWKKSKIGTQKVHSRLMLNYLEFLIIVGKRFIY